LFKFIINIKSSSGSLNFSNTLQTKERTYLIVCCVKQTHTYQSIVREWCITDFTSSNSI